MHPRRINPTVIKRRRTTSMALAAFLTAIAASTTPTPLQVGQTFLATVDDPAQGNNGWSLVSHGVGEKLYTLNDQNMLVPQLAQRVERTSENKWAVTLKSGRHFSDGSPVTAADVAASHVLMHLNP